MVLTQLRRDDLAYHSIGLAIDAGRNAADDVVVAAAVCGENWLLTRQARFDEAEQAALSSAEAIEPSLTRSSAAHVAVWGWLNLGAAAHVAAPYHPVDVAHWTSFNPAIVSIREAEIAMVVGDADVVLRVAGDVPAENPAGSDLAASPPGCGRSACRDAPVRGGPVGAAGTVRQGSRLAAVPAVRAAAGRSSGAGSAARRARTLAGAGRLPRHPQLTRHGLLVASTLADYPVGALVSR
jgi:hypothetical protein